MYGDPLPEGAVARLGTTRWRHDGEAWATAFSPNGKVLACAAFNGLIYLWDTATGREIRRLRMADNEQGLYTQSFIGFFPDGRILYATDARGIVRYWNVHLFRSLRDVGCPRT